MDDSKGYCDFDSENIIEINGSTSRYFDEDGSIKTKDKGGIEGDCMFKYIGSMTLYMAVYNKYRQLERAVFLL